MDRDVLLAVATAVDEDGQEKEQDDDDQEDADGCKQLRVGVILETPIVVSFQVRTPYPDPVNASLGCSVLAQATA